MVVHGDWEDDPPLRFYGPRFDTDNTDLGVSLANFTGPGFFGKTAADGDTNGDGDVDIVSKVWNADGPTYHLDLWRNELNPND